MAEQCPICKKPSASKFKPFCSSRCSMIDLGKWLGEGYKLKTDENAQESEPLPSSGDDEEPE